MNYYETDPEFMERFEHFAFDEVVNEESRQLEPKTRYLVVLAALIGCQGEAAYREILPKALEAGLSPVAVKETVYQAVDYLGMGRMWQFLRAANEIFVENEIGASALRAGGNHHGRPAGKRRAGTDRYFRRTDERSLEKRTYQSLACGQLFW